MTRRSALYERLAAGSTVLIDGGTGTELERLGVPMVEGVWCADAARTHPHALRTVHCNHIGAGADLVIANTFATQRYTLAWADLTDEFEYLNRRSVQVALDARERAGRPDVVVAASMSTTQQDGRALPPLHVAARDYADMAEILADAGAEVIVLEMMRDLEHTRLILDAALATGLPVWLGWSTHDEGPGREPLLYNRGATVREGMALIADDPIEVVSIMHTEIAEVDAALDVVMEMRDGPVGVYAHSGIFEHPNWIFNDVVMPSEYLGHAERWVDRGVQVIGGCCGITSDHISLIAGSLSRRGVAAQ